MKKKLLVAGSRYFTDYEKAKAVIDRCVAQSGEREFIILSGGALDAPRDLHHLLAAP